MTQATKTPVIILNGFLGSGKTTLFRNLLGQAKRMGCDVRAIVNDMSELDVDGELIGNTAAIEDNKDVMVSIHSCVLSSSKGIEKLNQALRQFEVNSPTPPDLIIIETSGSCHPMPLIQYFQKSSTEKLIGVFVLVDSLMLGHDYDSGSALIPKFQQNLESGKRNTVNLLVEQIMFASHIFLTKSDRIAARTVGLIEPILSRINPNAVLQKLHYGKMSFESIFALTEYNYRNTEILVKELSKTLDSASSQDRPYNIATRVIRDDRPFHPQRLWDVCHKYLNDQVYRSKGFFWLASRDKFAMLWNQAAGGINLEVTGSWRAGIAEEADSGVSEMELAELRKMLDLQKGRFGDRRCDLTVIGNKSNVDEFTAALESCFLTEEEIELWRSGIEFADPWPRDLARIWN
ncbi:MAG: cobalamin biosynthesis protein CobW [Flavobacteriales bacterium]|nr:cobalamin biosynthesis protein CobW [Flavobacteriales bacterium]